MDVGSRAEREVSEGHKPEIVPTVAINTLCQSYHKPYPKCHDVALEEKRANEVWDGDGKEVFKGVEVFSIEPNWLVVSVVELVEAFVEEGEVKETVQPVEDGVLSQ